MDAALQEMLDHYRISQLVAEYSQGCDRGDEPQMAGVYCDESWDDHGHYSGRGVEFARAIMEGSRNNKCLSHLIGQTMVKVDGDEAGAETYFFAAIVADGADGGEFLHQLGGRFADRVVREGDGWRIKSRTAIRDWSITLPLEQDWIGGQGLKQGRRSGRDLGLMALGRVHSEIPGFE